LKSSSNPSTGLIIAATILSGIGLAPLLLATLGFVTTIAAHGAPLSQQLLRGCRILLTAGLVLAIAGGSMLTPDNSSSSISTGHTLAKVGVILFLAAYGLLFALHIRLWQERQDIAPNHRTLLSGVSLALPPLLVRIIYSILSAFASSTTSRFSALNGDWRIFLVMGLIMEFIVVCVYVGFGALTPLHKDNEGVGSRGPVRSHASDDGLLEMGGYKNAYAPGPGGR